LSCGRQVPGKSPGRA